MFLHTTLLPVIVVILFWNACRDLIRKKAFILQDILLLHPDKKNSHSGSLKTASLSNSDEQNQKIFNKSDKIFLTAVEFWLKIWCTQNWFSECLAVLFHVDEEMKYSTDTKKNACPPNSCYKNVWSTGVLLGNYPLCSELFLYNALFNCRQISYIWCLKASNRPNYFLPIFRVPLKERGISL